MNTASLLPVILASFISAQIADEPALLSKQIYSDSVNSLAWCGPNLILSTGSDSFGGQEVKLWKLNQNPISLQLIAVHKRGFEICRVHTSADQRRTYLRWVISPNVQVLEISKDSISPGALFRGKVMLSAMALSKDGAMVATGQHDSTIRVWNPTTGKSLIAATGAREAVYSLAFSPDSTQLASIDGNRKLVIWKLTAKAISRVKETVLDNEPIRDLDFSGPKEIVSIKTIIPDVQDAEPPIIRVEKLNLDTGAKKVTNLHPDRKGNIQPLLLDAINDKLVTANIYGHVVYWNLSSEKKMKQWMVNTNVKALALSPDRSLLAVGDFDAKVHFFKLK